MLPTKRYLITLVKTNWLLLRYLQKYNCLTAYCKNISIYDTNPKDIVDAKTKEKILLLFATSVDWSHSQKPFEYWEKIYKQMLNEESN